MAGGYVLRLSAVMGLLLALPAGAETAPDPVAIVTRMEQVMRGDSSFAEMTMRILRPRYERELALQAWLLGREYSMILVTAPARDRGTAFLMRRNQIWSYDPRIERTMRLPSSMMGQSWMGSDFTNDDLVRDSDVIDDYEHTLLRSEAIDGRPCYVIGMVPKPDRPIVWGKVKMWITQEDYLQVRVENFDQREQRVNTMVLDRIRSFGDRSLPSRITVTPEGKPDERTVLEYETLEFDIDIDEDFFQQRNLQRIR